MTRSVIVMVGVLLTWMLAPVAHAQPGPVSEARTLAAQGDYDAALRHLGAYLAENPDDVEARLFEGVVYTRLGRTEDAVNAFRKLAADHPDIAEPHNNLAVLYAADGRYVEARDALLSAVELRPGYSTAHENLGDVYAKLASLAYEKASELNEDNTRVQVKAEIIEQVFSSPPRSSLAGAPPPPTPPTPSTPPGANADGELACLKVTGYESDDARDAIVTWLGDRGMNARERAEQKQVARLYQVYMSPFDDAQAANAQVEQMKDKGIQDIIRISHGALENGISFGVYSSEARARRRVAQLASKGYESQYETVTQSATVRWLESSAAGSEVDEAAFTRRFPFVAAEHIPCE